MEPTRAGRSIADDIRQKRQTTHLRNHLAEAEAHAEKLEGEVRALEDERRVLRQTVETLEQETGHLSRPRRVIEHKAAAAALKAMRRILIERDFVSSRSSIARIIDHQTEYHRTHAARGRRGRK